MEIIGHTKDTGGVLYAMGLRNLANVYVAKEDYQKAYTYDKRFLLLKDSIFNIENVK